MADNAAEAYYARVDDLLERAVAVATWRPGNGLFWEKLSELTEAGEMFEESDDVTTRREAHVHMLRAIAARDPGAVKEAYDALQDALISQEPPFIGGEPSAADKAEHDVETEIVQEHQRLIGTQQMAKDRFIRLLAHHYKEHGPGLGGAATAYLDASARTVDFVQNHPQLAWT